MAAEARQRATDILEARQMDESIQASVVIEWLISTQLEKIQEQKQVWQAQTRRLEVHHRLEWG